MSNTFVIRIQSSEGTKRIYINPEDTYKTLYEKVSQEFSLILSENFILYQEQNHKSPINRSQIRINLRHGDMIYLVPQRTYHKSIIVKSDQISSQLDYLDQLNQNKDNDIEIQLDKIDGRIARELNPQLCHHNKYGKCLHCIPIEPYDEEYLKNHNPPIKHMSFQAYIRKLQSSTSNDRNTLASLKNINCSIKDACSTGHLPWPKGICTSCQPNPVTLMRQSYRHVDNIMFENGNMVNRFLQYWRTYGHQRVGFLYGRYEVYDGVPLGIRATIAAIYEPPQETSKDNVQLILPDPHEALVEKLAYRLGLRRVGWIFTDLIPNDKKIGPGPVLHHRGNVKTCFLTAQECIMAGDLQNRYLNMCKYSSDGYFGSKFVTVVVTGDASGQIHFEGYQVSNQCMALVKSKILIPTYDAPELGYIKETSPEQYVPDVYYKEKDLYNNEIMKIGRPLPLEYLIVDIPTGFPAENAKKQSTFNDDCMIIKTPFGIENRAQIHELQDMDTLALYLQQFSDINQTLPMTKSYEIRDIFADFHLLIYLANNEIYRLTLEQLDLLLDALHHNDLNEIEKWMNGNDWQILLQLLQIDFAKILPRSITDDSQQLTSEWNCKQCTFLNNLPNEKCLICDSVRNP